MDPKPDAGLGRRCQATAPVAPHCRQGTRPGPRQTRAIGEEGGLLFLDNGEVLTFPKKRALLGPCYDFTAEEALQVQLEALRKNNDPYADHGVEVLYRFSNFDPFTRSSYFGRSLDLGQFERFRRVMHTPYYATLLDHSSAEVLSSLQLAEGVWCARLHVHDTHRMEERTYSVTMQQRLGGHYDGWWFTERWVADGQDVRRLSAD
ncbi:hypothetical protein HYH03_017423 [Edaphochlamys debaryana]|uniref:Uncharacterized protein n=1 Tax=Edaphochlamys debaryana TaxID=47281 RepID=A0A835XHW1_9CHLO|nr:hypothetical protein HYH03_017423 [Edaphochlamys debaryana]|eukprot:KAG2483704.1 hypothetical protein HYH03_017423 [Edaphochlamys debaryana]